ncbi:hypothetical protein TNCV_3614371 [Trichonephila clavipes]|uniref:Uncharacterized protein n=1 Tax=Trichonephila clavipes TaxID=2585209 RepID=A0A8X6SMN7_TRICX|nr:hypothetical protein TNCV_3614371 [Trichonephila clavipes]
MQVTVRFCSVLPQFRGIKPWGWSGASHISSPSTNHTRGLAARRLFRVPPCRKVTIHLQSSMSSSGFEPSPYGIAVSVSNHYTGWATWNLLLDVILRCTTIGHSHQAFCLQATLNHCIAYSMTGT